MISAVCHTTVGLADVEVRLPQGWAVAAGSKTKPLWGQELDVGPGGKTLVKSRMAGMHATIFVADVRLDQAGHESGDGGGDGNVTIVGAVGTAVTS